MSEEYRIPVSPSDAPSEAGEEAEDAAADDADDGPGEPVRH
jgi:hypothetical protein